MEKINKKSSSQYEIEISLTAKELEKYLDKAILEDIKKVKEPGFRPGKMPKAIFLKKYGLEAVYPTAIDLILNDIYPKIIVDNKLDVVAQPEFDWSTMQIDKEKGFEVKGTVDVMPEIVLTDLEAVKSNIEKPVVKVSKSEVKKEIDNLLIKDAKYTAKEDYEAKNGDITVIDFEGFVDDVAFEGGKGQDHALTLGSNTFIPGFEDQLIGSKKGDKVDVKVTFPEEYQAPDLAGKEAIFKCEVKEVKKRTLPRLTDAKIKELEGFEVDNKEDLEKEIENKIKLSKESNLAFEYEKKVLDAIVKDIKLDVPTSMINNEVEHTIKNLEDNFKQQGFGLEMYLQMTGMDMDGLKAQVSVEAKDRIAKTLIIEQYIKDNDIKISAKEVNERMKKISKDYNISEEEILKQVGEDKAPIKRDLQFEKANEILFK